MTVTKTLLKKRHLGLLSLALSCAGFALIPNAYAQLPAEAESAAFGQADPGRVQEGLSERRLPTGLTPQVQVRDLVLQDMPENADKIQFTLNSIRFEGIGVYTEADIRSVYADKLGEVVTLEDVYVIATALTNKYRNDGYILTQVIVPPQTIDGGVVTLRAVEGYVDQIRVSGSDDESALDLIREYANNIRSEGGALNVADLEKFLLLINDLPGVNARSVLSPSRTQTGASDLQIIVERDPYDLFAAIDNYGSRYLGPVQVSLAGSLNSYFGMNERITGQVVVAPDSYELGFYSVSYEQPIGTHGTTVEVLASHTDTQPGFILEQFEVEGLSNFYSVTAEHPFLRSRNESLYGYAVFDWRDVESSNDLEPTREDRIRAVRLGGTYEFLDNLLVAGINTLGLEFAQGLNVFGASSKDDIRLSRPAGDPTFTKVNASVQRLQRVTSKVNLLVAAEGQLSNGALLSSEEFGVGGAYSARGYDPSEIVGDEGFSTTVEVQWNDPINWNYVDSYQLFSFYDFGKVYNDDSTTSDDDDSIASVGVGARASIWDTQASLAVAFPLTRKVETTTNEGAVALFSVSKNF